MLFTHAIFDLDGTLLDTLDDLAAAANHVCELHGWPTFTRDQYRQKVGNGMPKLVERFMPAGLAGDRALFEDAYRELLEYYGLHKEDTTRPYDGMIEALDALRASGMTLAVLSNKDDAAVGPLVEHYFGDRFAAARGRTDAFPPKPAAPATVKLLEDLGAAPERTVYVGDSNVDVQTGKNAGLVTIGVDWGFRGDAELNDTGADLIAYEPRDLVTILRP